MNNQKILFIISIIIYTEVSCHRRIFGGREAKEGQYPYLALFAYKVTAYRIVAPICGGAIINQNHILTASHCIEPPTRNGPSANFMVMVGSKYARINDGVWYYIKTVFLTENQKLYGPPVDDIALIRIWGKFEFGKKVQPVKLSRSNVVPLKTPGIVAGWGQYIQKPHQENSAKLMTVEMTITDNYHCESYWKKFDSLYNICVISPYYTGTCNGDSGGPLVINGILYGVLSYGHADCANGVPEVYINVGVYYKWIQEKLKQ